MRDSVDQLARITVLRVIQDLACFTVLDKHTTFKHGNTIRNVGNHAEIVRDEQHPHLPVSLNLPDQFKNFGLRRHVERGGRLIGNQQRRFKCERDRNQYALSLTAGQRRRVRVTQQLRLRKSHEFE